MAYGAGKRNHESSSGFLFSQWYGVDSAGFTCVGEARVACVATSVCVGSENNSVARDLGGVMRIVHWSFGVLGCQLVPQRAVHERAPRKKSGSSKS
jgi:hypothetical protein